MTSEVKSERTGGKAAPVKVDTVWSVVEAVTGVTPRVLLSGPPGTGKTFAALTLGVAPGQRVFSLTCTEDMSKDEMRGHYVVREGSFVWQDGPALVAWRVGGRLVVNEVDKASGDALSMLLNFLDDADSAQMTLITGEDVRPAPGFSCVATMNGDPDVDLTDAVRDRFPVTVHVDKVHPAALARLPKDLQASAERGVLAPEVERRTSIRVWLAFAALRDAVGADVAARACFGARAQDVLNGLKIGGA